MILFFKRKLGTISVGVQRYKRDDWTVTGKLNELAIIPLYVPIFARHKNICVSRVLIFAN